MRFSLRTMTSGARSSMSFLRRLLRLMTRRYRSLRSDVAKRPPSSGTSGRSSGGMTGMTSMIIHSGRLPDSRKLSTTFSRLMIFFGFGADSGGEGILAIFILCGEKLVFGQQLVLLERSQARLDHDVALEIEDSLELLQLHVEQQADAARQALQEPDVRDRGSQLDVAHALAADLGDGHLDAALLAHDSLVLHALVLAAQAFVVLDRAEDARAEQAVTLGLERAVVDRLRLLDLAERPAADLVRARDTDLDLVERLRLGDRICEWRQFVHLFFSPSPSRLREGLGEGMSQERTTGPPPTPPASGRGACLLFSRESRRRLVLVLDA